MMKSNKSLILQIILLTCILKPSINATAVSTNPVILHSRIGDIFTFIVKAMWFAHKHTIPYVHRECSYTNDTNLSRCESFAKHCNKTIIRLDTNQDFKSNNDNSMYEISYNY